MPVTSYLHGVEVERIDTGLRPIQVVRSAVIGVVGTAPLADATAFPLDEPVLITRRTEISDLGTTGTLPTALDLIFDQQVGAVVVVVRTDEGADQAEATTNVIGGVDGSGNYIGLQAFLAARSMLGQTPKLLIAPGFTHQRSSNGILTIPVLSGGSGYDPENPPVVTITDATGSGAKATAVVTTDAVASITIDDPGSDYTAPVVTIAAPDSGTTATADTATLGEVRNRVVSELLAVATRLRAMVIADGPGTTDAAAIQVADDFGSERVYVVDPHIVSGGVTTFASPAVAGLINRIDNERGYWWSPSNQELYGFEALSRHIDFELGDTTSRANLLNEGKIATIIREDGFRLWGNKTLASDQKYQFINVVRTADVIAESIMRSHLWAVDRCITRVYLEEVMESVRQFLRELESRGAILGGDIWVDPDLNQPATIANGNVVFDFEFTPCYPAERVTFRSHLVNDYIINLFN